MSLNKLIHEYGEDHFRIDAETAHGFGPVPSKVHLRTFPRGREGHVYISITEGPAEEDGHQFLGGDFTIEAAQAVIIALAKAIAIAKRGGS